MHSYFRCNNCGTYNSVGAPACIHCYRQLFYNCPRCGAWVDNRYMYCPNCLSLLNWPEVRGLETNSYTAYNTFSGDHNRPTNKMIWAIVLAGVFVIGVIYMILINPTNSDANKLSRTTSSSVPQPALIQSKPLPTTQPQITISGLTGTPSTDPALPERTAEPSTTLPNSNGDRIEVEMYPLSVTSTNDNGYVPKTSNYLQQLWPGWGHCSKGSCQAFTQP